jgi:hypothetical protein
MNRGGTNKGNSPRNGKGNKGGANKGNSAKGGKGNKGGANKGNSAKNGKGKGNNGKGNSAKNGNGKRNMPRAVADRARSRGYDFSGSRFSPDLGIQLYLDGGDGGDGGGSWYYWYAPFDSYLPVDFVELYPPVDDPDLGVIDDDNPV